VHYNKSSKVTGVSLGYQRDLLSLDLLLSICVPWQLCPISQYCEETDVKPKQTKFKNKTELDDDDFEVLLFFYNKLCQCFMQNLDETKADISKISAKITSSVKLKTVRKKIQQPSSKTL
jgi:hypothetical protein